MALLASALRTARAPTVMPWVALVSITVAESITALVSVQLGFLVHLALVALLLVYATAGPDRAMRDLALGLTLAPIIRLLSIGLPLNRVPQVAWYAMVAAPLFISVALVMRQANLSRSEVGLRWGNIPRELAFGASGIALGLVEYHILRPSSLLQSQSLPQILLTAATLVIFTGLFEEFLFRGVLQQLAWRALGFQGLVLVSLLFAALHIGYRSLLDLLFVGATGALFAYVMLRGGSLLGISIAHGLTNVLLLVVIPNADAATQQQIAGYAIVGVIIACAALIWMARARPYQK